MLELRDAIIARLKEPPIDGIGARVHPRNEFESVAQAGQQGPTLFVNRITSYNVCYTKLLRYRPYITWAEAGYLISNTKA